MPLIKGSQLGGEQSDEKYGNLMDKKQIINELVDYNLMLLRMIYDAFEERADMVV